jgi:GNAT superfamily N-acetyltransferase
METASAERVLEFRPVSFTEILDSPRAKALLKEYAKECSIPELGFPNPQRETYARMEEAGLMYALGAFQGEDLVGFATILVFVLPHYGTKIANVESLFLAKSHRVSNAGVRLMETIEAQAESMLCIAVLYNARAGSSLERLLTYLPSYQRTNSVFLRSLS